MPSHLEAQVGMGDMDRDEGEEDDRVTPELVRAKLFLLSPSSPLPSSSSLGLPQDWIDGRISTRSLSIDHLLNIR